MEHVAAKAGGARRKLSAHVVFALALSPLLSAQPQSSPPSDLADASIEDLMNIEVTSVSRKEQKLSNTAAAVYVINQEMIRRSGATNIPDLLRMAPGVDVAQIDANTWAISIRGFNDRYANKVLVLVDGRTVYTPTTSGVYWDQLDVPLEDIERIEVIRGPGGTVWGANAVNGVINIITKSAKDTQGAIVSAGAGSQGAARGLAQYGGEIGEAGTYRVFGDYLNQGNLTASDGRSAAADGWHMLHGGFRSDWTLSPNDSLTVQGDFLETGEGQTINVVFTNQLPLQETFNDAISVGSGNALARWNHKLAGGSDTSLQVYFDRYNRHDEGVHEALNTLDVDFQHHLSLGVRHDIVWGAGYRVTADNHTDGYGKMYIPLSRTNSLYSTFIQDEIALAHTLWFTLGSKFEHNAYTGFEYEPSAKLLWQPTQRQAVWVSASRAIVQTSREEADLIVDQYTFPTPGGGFGVAQLQGNPDAKAEQLYDFEAGYRVQVNKAFSLDIAAFSSYYDNLSAVVPEDPIFTQDEGPPHLVIPFVFQYVARAHTYGAEAEGTWSVSHRWRLSPSLSAIHLSTSNDEGSTNVIEDEDNTPEFQAQIRSSLDLTKNIDWDVAVDHVGRLRDGGDGAVPAYNRVDSRLAWRVSKSIELSVVGQNLLTPLHAEFHNAFEVRRTLVERSVFGKITWRF
jgi:iron complex outermembrane receptor protein